MDLGHLVFQSLLRESSVVFDRAPFQSLLKGVLTAMMPLNIFSIPLRGRIPTSLFQSLLGEVLK